MNPKELMRRLASLSAPDRGLDGEIGLLLGYTRRINVDTLSATKKKSSKAVWDSPTEKGAKLPYFTKFINDAYVLAQTALPGQIGGVSWDMSGGSARMGKGPYVTAASPAIALCIAVLGNMAEQETE